MFWTSVLGGLKTMLQIQVIITFLIYCIVHILWVFLWRLVKRDDLSSKVHSAAYGILYTVIGGAFNAILLGFVIAILYPILLGGVGITPISLTQEFAWSTVRISLVAFCITSILAVIPLIGEILAKTPGLIPYIQGLIIFNAKWRPFIQDLTSKLQSPSTIYPSIWHIIGFFGIAFIVFFIVITAIYALVKDNNYKSQYADSEILHDSKEHIVWNNLFVIAAIDIASLIPIFMYANYVNSSLQLLIQ